MKYMILFQNNKPIPAEDIEKLVKKFGRSYDRTVRKIIKGSRLLGEETFKANAATLLPNFKMTRAKKSPFFGIRNNRGKIEDPENKLQKCWDAAKEDLLFLRMLLNSKKIEPRTRNFYYLMKIQKNRLFPTYGVPLKRCFP